MYYSIIESLKSMAKKKGFLEKCNLWRTRSEHFLLNMMGDIYDGRLRKDMMYINDRPFLATPNNLCLSLNVDWFKVYEHSQYSGTFLQRPCLGSSLLTLVESLAAFRVYFLL